MNTVGERIRYLRKRLKLTQKQFAERAHLSSGHRVYDFEKGLYTPSTKTIQKIAQAFNVSPNWLISGVAPKENHLIVAAPKIRSYKTPALTIPIINEVPAGYPEYPIMEDQNHSYITLPNLPSKSFGLFVSGDSMKPEICNKDIVIVDPVVKDLKKGEIGVFRIHGDATIKVCEPLEDNKGYVLRPINPEFKSILVTDDTECVVIGKVIYVILKK